MRTFQAGAVYAYTHICNADLHHAYRVVRRTASSVWLEDSDGSVKRRGVKPNYDGREEVCSPEGSFSMSPILGACDRLADDHSLGPWSTGMGP